MPALVSVELQKQINLVILSTCIFMFLGQDGLENIYKFVFSHVPLIIPVSAWVIKKWSFLSQFLIDFHETLVVYVGGYDLY